MKQYFCVWVDHTEANILGVGMDTTNGGIVSNQGAKDHAHRSKTDLIAHLREQFPAVAKKIWSVAAVDHPTDGELVVAARQFFKTATRVHS